jgi:CheY-like chemotaxis protein
VADAPSSVLIVEDDSIIAWHLSSMVRRLGYTVCATAVTEDAALAAARAHAPDIVLMDVRLASLDDGVRAAEAIRAELDVPIVFCTAHADEPSFQSRIATFGRSSVLGKPVAERQLKAALDSLLQAAR